MILWGSFFFKPPHVERLDVVQKGLVVEVRVGPGGIPEVVCSASMVDMVHAVLQSKTGELHEPELEPAEGENRGCQGHSLD